MSPITIPTPSIPLPLPDEFDVSLIGSYAATVWELVNQNSLITVVLILLAAGALLPILFNLITHRRSVTLEEEDYYRR